MDNYKSVSFSSPSKIILSGEHSVLYGYKCIAFCIDLFTKVNL